MGILPILGINRSKSGYFGHIYAKLGNFRGYFGYFRIFEQIIEISPINPLFEHKIVKMVVKMADYHNFRHKKRSSCLNHRV